MLPLININPNIKITGIDYAKTAIKLLNENDLIKNNNNYNAYVIDITNINDINKLLKKNSKKFDCILMLFVLSALNPKTMENAVNNLIKLLKPNGFILFRDYAINDLAQTRFKYVNRISHNFYQRNDQTYSYFFSIESIKELFINQQNNLLNIVDLNYKKMIVVNKSLNKKMKRVFIEGIFIKNNNI